MDKLNQWEIFAKEFPSYFEYVHMRRKMNSNRYEISFRLKISRWCSVIYLCLHELRRNETQNDMDFKSVILTEMIFQTGMRFSCEHNLPETKWISANSLDVGFNAHVCLKLIAGINFISFILTEIKFHFRW